MVCVFLADGFEEIEAIVPIDLLRRGGVEVTTVGVSESGVTITGGQGMVIVPDTTIDLLVMEKVEMLVLPGGMGGVQRLRENHYLCGLISEAVDRGVWVGAICAAPTILANLGHLDRRSGVCYPGLEEGMGSAVVKHGEQVVIDGRIITAQAAGSSFEFGLALLTALRGEEVAKRVQENVYFTPRTEQKDPKNPVS